MQDTFDLEGLPPDKRAEIEDILNRTLETVREVVKRPEQTRQEKN